MHYATVIRDKSTGQIHVRYADEPQTGGYVEVLEVLSGENIDDLERRATDFALSRGPGTKQKR